MDAKTRPLGLSLAAALALASPARAQLLPDVFPPTLPGYGTDPGVTVQSRARPDYDPLGTRVGNVIVRPQLDESMGYDSNVLGGGPGAGSLVLRSSPSLLISGSGPQTNYGLYLGLDDTRTPEVPGQDRTDWVTVGGATVTAGQNALTLGLGHLSLHQDRSDLDALPSDQPVAYQVDDLRAKFSMTRDRLTIEPSADIAAWRFDGTTEMGLPVAQSYRDRNVAEGGLTVRYELAPRRSFVVSLLGTGQFYTATPAGAVSPDSNGLTVLAGINDAEDGLWHYRLLAGWERRGFVADTYHPHDAGVAQADLVFNPDGMTTITATLARTIEDAAQEGVSGFVYTTAKITADYEWRRNVILSASGGVQRADLLDSGGHQTALRGGLAATWLVNRRVRITGTYDLADIRSAGGSTVSLPGSFVRSVTLVTVRLGL